MGLSCMLVAWAGRNDMMLYAECCDQHALTSKLLFLNHKPTCCAALLLAHETSITVGPSALSCTAVNTSVSCICLERCQLRYAYAQLNSKLTIVFRDKSRRSVYLVPCRCGTRHAAIWPCAQRCRNIQLDVHVAAAVTYLLHALANSLRAFAWFVLRCSDANIHSHCHQPLRSEQDGHSVAGRAAGCTCML